MSKPESESPDQTPVWSLSATDAKRPVSKEVFERLDSLSEDQLRFGIWLGLGYARNNYQFDLAKRTVGYVHGRRWLDRSGTFSKLDSIKALAAMSFLLPSKEDGLGFLNDIASFLVEHKD